LNVASADPSVTQTFSDQKVAITYRIGRVPPNDSVEVFSPIAQSGLPDRLTGRTN
jgi:hypothetical protein